MPVSISMPVDERLGMYLGSSEVLFPEDYYQIMVSMYFNLYRSLETNWYYVFLFLR